jgi:hypothetical protein
MTFHVKRAERTESQTEDIHSLACASRSTTARFVGAELLQAPHRTLGPPAPVL